MRSSPLFRCEKGSAERLRGSIVTALLACAVALPVSDAAAQGSEDCPDTEIASALDNYRLAWDVSKGRLGADDASEGAPQAPDLLGTPWERVTGEAHDGVDGLRSGAIGDNEHTALTARIEGPATLSFWWRVDSQELADYLTFSAEPEIKANAADGPSELPITVDPIAGKRGWTKAKVFLREETAYRARWSYVKDISGRAGADAGWIDEVRVEGPGYGEIQMDYETEGDLVTLSWPTLPCRHYQVEWQPTDGSLPWQSFEVEPTTGAKSSLDERATLYAKRDYRVTLVEPPSFTLTPPSQDFAEKEGDSLTLKYEAEGSGTIKYSWKFRATNNDRPERLPIPEDGREIVSAGKGSTLRINSLTEAHEGEYILVAKNEAGREPAPPVSVSVFQPPRLEAFVVREGEEPKSRIAMDDPGAPSPPGLSVNAGESLEVEPEVTGSGSIGAKWERQDPRSGEWQLLTEGPDLGLRFGRVTPEDGGQYRVTLTSSMREREGPHVVAVTVNTSPSILCVWTVPENCLSEDVEAGSVEVTQFDPLALTVNAEGSKLSYSWFREGDPVLKRAGGESAKVTVSTDRAGDFEYKVIVTNETGKFDYQLLSVSVLPASGGAVFRDCDDCPEMVVIPEGSLAIESSAFDTFDESVGTFVGNHCTKNISRSSTVWEDGREPETFIESWSWECSDDLPNVLIPRSMFVRERAFDRRIAIGRYEITRSEFGQFIHATDHIVGSPCWIYGEGGYRPELGITWVSSGFEQGERHPAVCVSWADADAYVVWLSKKTGKQYRLLEEAEWEFAARAGTVGSRYWDGDEENDRFFVSRWPDISGSTGVDSFSVAWSYQDATDTPCTHANGSNPDSLRAFHGFWTLECDDGATHSAPVGSFAPNDFGLFDVLGNVEEWVVGDCERGVEIEPKARHHPFIEGDPPEYTYSGDCWRISRGQSWLSGRFHVSARERGKNAGYRASFVGFRIARDIAP